MYNINKNNGKNFTVLNRKMQQKHSRKFVKNIEIN